MNYLVIVVTLLTTCVNSLALGQMDPTGAEAISSPWKPVPNGVAKDLFIVATPDDSEDYNGQIGESRILIGGCHYIKDHAQFKMEFCDYAGGTILSPAREHISDYLLSTEIPVFAGELYAVAFECTIVRKNVGYQAICKNDTDAYK